MTAPKIAGQTIPALIRTYVPFVVAWLVGFLASLGIHLNSTIRVVLVGLIGTAAGWLYYAGVHWAEKRWPWTARLLGSAKQPTYPAAPVAPGPAAPAPVPPAKT